MKLLIEIKIILYYIGLLIWGGTVVFGNWIWKNIKLIGIIILINILMIILIWLLCNKEAGVFDKLKI